MLLYKRSSTRAFKAIELAIPKIEIFHWSFDLHLIGTFFGVLIPSLMIIRASVIWRSLLLVSISLPSSSRFRWYVATRRRIRPLILTVCLTAHDGVGISLTEISLTASAISQNSNRIDWVFHWITNLSLIDTIFVVEINRVLPPVSGLAISL